MGSGGSLTLWSPSNEAGMRGGLGFNRCTMFAMDLGVIWRFELSNHPINKVQTGLSLMVGLFKRE